MASKNQQNSYNNANPPKYINDFTKALAGEMRVLLDEVGKLRDEKRQLQYEISELMAVRAKYGPGGEYVPDWMPKPPQTIEPPPPPPEEGAVVPLPAPAPPGWRTVHKREPRKPRPPKPHPGATPPPAAIAAPPEPPRPELPSWAQWRPNPLLAPPPLVTSSGQAPSSPPPRSGLFGPSTPPPK